MSERREKEREVERKKGKRVREKESRKSERDEKSRVASFQIFSLKVYSRVKLDRKSKKQTSFFPPLARKVSSHLKLLPLLPLLPLLLLEEIYQACLKLISHHESRRIIFPFNILI